MTTMPEGFSTVTPHLMVNGATKALDHYVQALGAEVLGRIDMPGTDLVMHASFKVGNSIMFLSDPVPGTDRKPPKDGPASTAFYLYVADADASYAQALAHGMTAAGNGPEDMFWGDRTAVASDLFGYNWTFATKIRDVSPEEMMEAMKQMGS